MNRELFKQVQKGSRPSANEHNKLTSLVSSMSSSMFIPSFKDSTGFHTRRQPNYSQYIDRGTESVTWDFGEGDLTKDGAWHDLDLSGVIVPVEAKLVLFECEVSPTSLYPGGSTAYIRFRSKRPGQDLNCAYIYLLPQLLNPTNFSWDPPGHQFLSPTVSAQKCIELFQPQTIEYLITAPANYWSRIRIIINGWWM